MHHVVVIGTTGSGKSTMAQKVAAAIGGAVIDLDDYLWLPGWVQRAPDEMLTLLMESLQADRWVVAGNNRKSRAFIWSKADTVIWLNYPFWINFPRLFWRTMCRVITKEEVMPGCVETFRSQFLEKDSLLLWFFQTFWKRKKEYRAAFQQEEFQHLTVVELKHPRQARRFLDGLPTGQQ